MIVLDSKKTGDKIKAMMAERSISVSDLAKRMGISTSAIYSWFYRSALPSLDNFVILAYVFGCKVDDILVCNMISD